MDTIERQLAWLARHFPELSATIVRKQEALVIEGPVESTKIPILRDKWNAQQESPKSYLDVKNGLLVVREKGFYVHVQLPRKSATSKLTPHQSGLLAALIETRSNGDKVVLPSRVRDLHKLLETIIGSHLIEMAVRRFLEANQDLMVESIQENSYMIERHKALDRLRAAVRERTLGKIQRFAIRDRDQVIDVVERVGAPAIYGVSAFLRDQGAVPGEDDLIVSRDALPALGDMLGRPVQSNYMGPTVLVRTPSHVKISVLAGRAGRRQLNPLLAHAVALTMKGAARDIAEAWSEKTI